MFASSALVATPPDLQLSALTCSGRSEQDWRCKQTENRGFKEHLGPGCFTDLKGLVLFICELGSLPGECPGWTCLDPDLYFQGILHNPSRAKHSPRLGQYGDFLCNFNCRRHLEQCPISEKSLNQRVQRKTCTSWITISSSPEVEFLLNLSVINRVAWSAKGCVKQETNRQSKGKEWKPKLSEMTHESTGSRSGTVWKREKWKKKKERGRSKGKPGKRKELKKCQGTLQQGLMSAQV